MSIIGTVLALILAYIIGSIPSGLILGKAIWQVDLREYGSHNIGATNAWRTIGRPAGILIFVCDLLKGMVGVWLASALGGGSALLQVICGTLAIVGHSWSLFLKFSGGKGVATGLGVITMLMSNVTILVFIIWFAIVYFTGYVSLGSIVAAALVPIFAFLFNYPLPYVIFGLIAAAFIIVRHKANIERLMNGTESKIKAAK